MKATDGAAAMGPSRFQVGVVAVMLAAGVVLYPFLPARIPLRWSVDGRIIVWGARNLLNVFFPVLIALGAVVAAALLPRIDPLRKSYARFSRSYRFVINLIVAFLAYLYGLTLLSAFHTTLPIGTLVPSGVGVVMVVVGNELGKFKRNFFIGIRTPWTLASETVWVRTHRIGARLFILAGIACGAASFLPAPANFILFLVILLGTVLSLFVISCVIYRRLKAQGKLTNGIREADTMRDVRS